MKKIKAILLAAGFGTRLRPITLNTPKCLVEINGKPLLAHWLEKLQNLGCSEVIINTHYLNKKVETFIKAYDSGGMKIKEYYEPNILGTAGTLLKNLDFFNDSIGLLIHADNFTNENLFEFINAHKNKPKDCLLTMLTFSTQDPSSCGIVKKDKLGRVLSFHEKSSENHGNCANAAVYAFDNSFIKELQYCPENTSDFSEEVLPLVINKIFTWHTNCFYIDIGNPESLLKANLFTRNKP